jgi:hypothetical protein
VVADEQRVQTHEERDLRARHVRRVVDVPRVDGGAGVVAELDVRSARDEHAQERPMTGGAVDDVDLAAARQRRRGERDRRHRLPAAGLGEEQRRAVVVQAVEGVQPLDGAAGVGEGERDPVGRAARC